MKVLITGPDGLLGSHIVRELLADGYAVRALVLPGSSSRTLEGLPIERFTGDIRNAEDVRKALVGCDIIIHAAASTSVWPTRSQKIWEVNLRGTQNVVNAALEKRVKRFIYVSSASSYRHGSKFQPGTEDQPYGGSHYRLDYIDSKYKAHEWVLKAVREKGLPAVLVSPTFMFGEYDSQPSSGKLIIAIYKGKVPGYTAGGKNFVYAKDVARACVNAITRGRVGECYIAGHKKMTNGELFEKIATIVGGKPPRLKLPNAIMRAYGYVGTAIGTLSRRPPTLNHATAKVSCDGQYYSSQKAVSELGMPQTPIEEAIRSAFNWLKTNHYVD